MTYIVISKENCSACEDVKDKFKKNNIDFKVIMKETMEDNEWQKYRRLALSSHQMSMPIIVDETGKLVNAMEVC